ncbi:hypothetical protein CR513_19172, partial [Mucuna pruriens]
MDRSMIDVASGGALIDKTPAVARLLISNMASNTQQFGVKGGVGTLRNLAFDDQRLENQLTELTSLVRQLAAGQHQQAVQRVCGICTLVEHLTCMCPTLYEFETESTKCVGTLGGGHQYGSAAYNAKVWTNWDHAGSESSQLSTVGTKIPGTSTPPTAELANATAGE